METYNKLREKLDTMSVGYPTTESGVELKILKKLFTVDEAKMFLYLSPFLETSEKIATRVSDEKDKIEKILKEMVRKGLIFQLHSKDSVRYAIVPYIPGIFEHQIIRMDKEYAKLHEEYFETALAPMMQSVKTPLLRTIPLNKRIAPDHNVAPYEDVQDIINRQDRIAVTDCVCRKSRRLIDDSCNKTLGNCFQFGSMADFFVENGFGRYIEKDSALKILEENEKEGFVMQPYNAKKMGALCSCCGDCCEILRSLKQSDKPVNEVNSNYYAVLSGDSCSLCEICMDRCQMDAIKPLEKCVSINTERCIGCGLCISTCPEEVLKLMHKPLDQLYEPPKNGMETFMKIAEERKFLN